jgi:hypothetical protein
MTNRLVIPLLCAASVVAFARGNVGHKATLAASSTEKHSKVALSSKFTVNKGSVVEFTLEDARFHRQDCEREGSVALE